MPFEYILANLLADIEGSVGVLFVDDSGEAVDLACVDYDHSQMKLMGAYVGIYLRHLERFLERDSFGDVDYLHVESQNLHIYAKAICDGYYLVLAQRPPALTEKVRRSLDRASSDLTRELFEPRKTAASIDRGDGVADRAREREPAEAVAPQDSSNDPVSEDSS